MKAVLVTGGAGFIGSTLTKHLLLTGKYLVIAVDNFDPFYDRAIKESNIQEFLADANYQFIEADLESFEALPCLGPVEIIIHLSAKAGVRPSIENPRPYWSANVGATHNLLEYARKSNVSKFVYASSSSVYGSNKSLPWTESDFAVPISPYGSSKLAGEILGECYAKRYGIQFLALRFFTVYGAKQRPDLAIYKFFSNIINGKPIHIYGDGGSARDYTNVDDVCRVILKSLEFQTSDFEVFNIGTGKSVLLKDLIYHIEAICNRKATIVAMPKQPGEIDITCADISKASLMLSYMPTVGIFEGLNSFYEWYIHQGDE